MNHFLKSKEIFNEEGKSSRSPWIYSFYALIVGTIALLSLFILFSNKESKEYSYALNLVEYGSYRLKANNRILRNVMNMEIVNDYPYAKNKLQSDLQSLDDSYKALQQDVETIKQEIKKFTSQNIFTTLFEKNTYQNLTLIEKAARTIYLESKLFIKEAINHPEKAAVHKNTIDENVAIVHFCIYTFNTNLHQKIEHIVSTQMQLVHQLSIIRWSLLSGFIIVTILISIWNYKVLLKAKEDELLKEKYISMLECFDILL